MGSLYVTEAANYLRNDGLKVVEYEGWKTRARSSGGFDPGKPYCVMWHHTASKTSPQNDSYYMCHTSDSRPIANFLVARDGSVWVLAAGATNTNGKGRSLPFSKGTVPADSMNTCAWGIEIANNGVGEPYPQVQIDAAMQASITMGKALGCQPSDICTHQHYAPDRKIDPSTAQAVQGSWQPRSINSSGTWNLQDLIDEHTRRWNAGNDSGGSGELTEADFEKIRQIVQDELNKGTGAGQSDWAGTEAAILAQVQNNYNQIRVVQEQINALVSGNSS